MYISAQVSSELLWISQMDVDIETPHARKSSIIGTIGKKLFIFLFFIFYANR